MRQPFVRCPVLRACDKNHHKIKTVASTRPLCCSGGREVCMRVRCKVHCEVRETAMSAPAGTESVQLSPIEAVRHTRRPKQEQELKPIPPNTGKAYPYVLTPESRRSHRESTVPRWVLVRKRDGDDPGLEQWQQDRAAAPGRLRQAFLGALALVDPEAGSRSGGSAWILDTRRDRAKVSAVVQSCDNSSNLSISGSLMHRRRTTLNATSRRRIGSSRSPIFSSWSVEFAFNGGATNR